VAPGSATITATAQDGSGKTGTATVTVTAPIAPVASAANSTITVTSTVTRTGGAAHLANGTDAYTFTITVRDTAGQIMTGQAGILKVNAPAALKVSAITDNNDGTYTFTATSATAGNYQIAATLSGTQIGAPVAVNYLAATSLQAKVTTGQAVTANATGFQPGEKVTVTAHSTPLTVGVFTATATGTVTAGFKVPADFNVGAHYVEFVGASSGSVMAPFEVIAGTQPSQAPAGPQVTTGGTLAGWPISPYLALTLLSLAAIIGAIGIRGQGKRVVNRG